MINNHIMEERLIGYDLAKFAKKCGFNLPTKKIWANYYTNEPTRKWKLISLEKSTLKFMEYPAPTQEELRDWLLQKYNISITDCDDDNLMKGLLLIEQQNKNK